MPHTTEQNEAIKRESDTWDAWEEHCNQCGLCGATGTLTRGPHPDCLTGCHAYQDNQEAQRQLEALPPCGGFGICDECG